MFKVGGVISDCQLHLLSAQEVIVENVFIGLLQQGFVIQQVRVHRTNGKLQEVLIPSVII